MILKIFSVRDSAADAFLQPFFAPNVGLALRSFVDAVNDPNHQFSKHASDYHLYLLGDFDDSNGRFSAEQDPVKISSALEVIMKNITPTTLTGA